VKVLVGYTVTKEGRAALARGVEEARLRGATLVVAHSIRGGERDETRRTEELGQQFAELEGQLEGADVAYELRHLVRGAEPAEDLLRFATEVNAGLIVIGVRRRSPVAKLVLGSNAQTILLQANCAVLAVKADED
jgi:nucleotide-binding universal stress UspA family protein